MEKNNKSLLPKSYCLLPRTCSLLPSSRGQSIIELLIAMGIAAIFLPALLSGLFTSRSGRAQQNERLNATSLLKEAEEATRVAREQNWSLVATPGIYYPAKSGSTWTLTSGAQSVNNFTRQIDISNVYRDSSNNIVSTGGTLDPATKKIVSTVSWTSPIASSVTSTAYLTQHFRNGALIDTTKANFDAGTLTNVASTNSSDGEIVLGAGGYGNWCTPSVISTTFDLPKSGVANAISAYEGRILAGTGENSSGVSLADLSVSNTKPPVVTQRGTFNGYKTNDVFVSGNYGYIATDTNAKEIIIVNMTSAPFAESGYFNAPGNGNGVSVAVSGNVGYATFGNKFYTFDVTSKTGARPQLGSLTLAATGQKVIVKGNYAYVAIGGAVVELQIIDISNPSSPTIVGQADVNGEAAIDVAVNDTATRAYLATTSSVTQKELFIVDISAKTGNRPTLGSYESNPTNPTGIAVASSNKIIEVGTGGEEYQVIDVTNEANPVRCGGTEINTGVQGIATVLEADGDAYSYIVTGDSSSELKVIEGGPGGQYSLSGTFESQTLAYTAPATPSQIILNYIQASIAKPANTDIKLQVATADAVAGSCSGVTFNYVGPDGTASTYFTSSDNVIIGTTVPLKSASPLKNPTYCLRYKAFLSTTDKFATPVLYDVNVNYSY